MMWSAAVVLVAAAPAAPVHISQDLPAARLYGSGTYRYFGIKVYDARLWTPASGYDALAPYVLELCYARSLDGRRIASASADEMAKVGTGTPAQRAAWLDSMGRLFPNVRAGDCISGHARPGAPTRFYFNGALLGEVADTTFGQAFFAIWLSPSTSAPALRESLLGQR